MYITAIGSELLVTTTWGTSIRLIPGTPQEVGEDVARVAISQGAIPLEKTQDGKLQPVSFALPVVTDTVEEVEEVEEVDEDIIYEPSAEVSVPEEVVPEPIG